MSDGDKLKMAVVGVGNMGRPHVCDVHELANTELVAVCDIKRVRADEVAAEYGVKAYYASDVPIRVCLPAGGAAFRLVMELLQRPAPAAADD